MLFSQHGKREICAENRADADRCRHTIFYDAADPGSTLTVAQTNLSSAVVCGEIEAFRLPIQRQVNYILVFHVYHSFVTIEYCNMCPINRTFSGQNLLFVVICDILAYI